MKEVAAREKAQEQLRQAQKMETIGQLTGGVAHDFNNLLMAVMGNLDLLRKRIARRSAPAPADRRRGAGRRARRVADAAAAGVRAAAGSARGAGRSARADPGHERSAASGRSGPRVALRLDIPRALPPARIDANQLELAILNLAINARDAMPDGGSIDIKVVAIPGEPAIRR